MRISCFIMLKRSSKKILDAKNFLVKNSRTPNFHHKNFNIENAPPDFCTAAKMTTDRTPEKRRGTYAPFEATWPKKTARRKNRRAVFQQFLNGSFCFEVFTSGVRDRRSSFR